MSDIFKKITETITETGKNVGEKTKQVGNTAKLNARIMSSERSVSENYTLIGKYYYDTYKNNPDEEIAETVNAVTAALNTIEDLKGQVLALKGRVNITVVVAPAFRLTEPDADAMLAFLKNELNVKLIYDVSFGADICTYMHLKALKEKVVNEINAFIYRLERGRFTSEADQDALVSIIEDLKKAAELFEENSSDAPSRKYTERIHKILDENKNYLDQWNGVWIAGEK